MLEVNFKSNIKGVTEETPDSRNVDTSAVQEIQSELNELIDINEESSCDQRWESDVSKIFGI